MKVLLQLLLYPTTDTNLERPSRLAFSDGYGLESVNMRLYEEHYAPDPAHWRRSPLRADLAGIAPTLLVTASLDPLRDEGRAYAAKAIAAGVPTTYREIQGTIHGFTSYRGVIPSARADLDEILDLAKAIIIEQFAQDRMP